MADDFDFSSMFSAMGAPTPPPRAVLASGAAASDYGTVGNEILGLSRSLLAGPTFGLSKDIEAGMSSVFGDQTYAQSLADINAQQRAYLGEHPVVGTVAEAGMGYALNPLSALGNLARGAKIAAAIPGVGRTVAPIMLAADDVVRVVPGARIAQQLATSVPAQGFLTGYGSADPTISNPLVEGLKGAAIGTAGSVVLNRVGAGLSRLATESDRLMLGSFGITTTDLGQNLKQALRVGAKVADSADIPLAKTIKQLNSGGIIDAESQVLENISAIARYQGTLSDELSSELAGLDLVAKPFPGFQSGATNKFVSGLSGRAQDAARAAVKSERAAIISQFAGGGSIEDLQRAKVGLNYAWDSMASTRDVQRAIRSDLRREIEDRAARLAKKGLIESDTAQRIVDVNKAWGAAAEAKDLFAKKAARDLGSDVVEDAFMQIRTTNGAGSLNIASAASGSIIPAALGQLMTAARTAKGKQFLSKALEDPLTQQLGAKLGGVLQEFGTGRSAAIAGKNVGQAKAEASTKGLAVNDRILSGRTMPAAPAQALTPEALAQALKLLGAGAPKKDMSMLGDLSIINEAEASDRPISKDMARLEKASKGFNVAKEIASSSKMVQAVAKVESNLKHASISKRGAIGLMQLMPTTATDMGVDPYDPKQNLAGGQKYLETLSARFKNDKLTFAAYNWGPGNLGTAIREAGTRDWDRIVKQLGVKSDSNPKGVPAETVAYVTKVMNLYRG